MIDETGGEMSSLTKFVPHVHGLVQSYAKKQTPIFLRFLHRFYLAHEKSASHTSKQKYFIYSGATWRADNNSGRYGNDIFETTSTFTQHIRKPSNPFRYPFIRDTIKTIPLWENLCLVFRNCSVDTPWFKWAYFS